MEMMGPGQACLRTDNKHLGYGDGQFTAFASDLGLRPGQFPQEILLVSHKTGRQIWFERKPMDPTRPGSHVFYYPNVNTDLEYRRKLSILLFND